MSLWHCPLWADAPPDNLLNLLEARKRVRSARSWPRARPSMAVIHRFHGANSLKLSADENGRSPCAGDYSAAVTTLAQSRSFRWSATRIAFATVVRVGFTAAELTKKLVSTT